MMRTIIVLCAAVLLAGPALSHPEPTSMSVGSAYNHCGKAGSPENHNMNSNQCICWHNGLMPSSPAGFQAAD